MSRTLHGGLTGFSDFWTSGPKPVTASQGGTAPIPPVMVVSGREQTPHIYPEEFWRAGQRDFDRTDPWRRGPDVVARRDEIGNTYFTDRQGSDCNAVPQ